MIRYGILLGVIHIGGRLPIRLTYALAWLGGTLAWHGSRRLRAITRDHARHVLGLTAERGLVDRTARGCLRSNLYYYADFARLGVQPAEAIFDSFDEIQGLDRLYEAIDQGHGVVLVSGHLGNGEFLAPAAAPFNICLAVVTEPLQPKRVHDLVHRVRQARGVRFLPANSSGIRDALRHLRGGGTLGLLVDRDVLGTARSYPFFGERARMPSGAVDLALRTGAPMFAAWVPRTGVGRYALHLEPVALPQRTGDRARDLDEGMRAMLKAVEEGIRRWPDQWFGLTPVWGEPERRIVHPVRART